MMAAFGEDTWVECYWCEGWFWDPWGDLWIRGRWEPEGTSLCDDCLDHFELFGVPPRPNAVDHRTNVLVVLIRPLNGAPDLARRIAEFLTDEYRPGQGSRAG